MYAISASGKTHKRRDCVPHAPTLWVICYAQMTLSSICSVKGHALTQMASQCILRSKASPGKPLLFRTIPDHRRNLHAERGRFRRFPLQKGEGDATCKRASILGHKSVVGGAIYAVGSADLTWACDIGNNFALSGPAM